MHQLVLTSDHLVLLSRLRDILHRFNRLDQRWVDKENNEYICRTKEK